LRYDFPTWLKSVRKKAKKALILAKKAQKAGLFIEIRMF